MFEKRIIQLMILLLLCMTAAWLAPPSTDAQSPANLGGPLIQFGVSPPIFEITLSAQNKPNALRVMNMGQETLTMQVNVFTWDLDEQNKTRIIPPTEQSLDQWMIINPTQFALAGGASQVIRFSIRPKVAPAPGEHRAIIFIKDASPPKKTKRNVTGQIGVSVYGYAGEITRIGILKGVSAVPQTNPVTIKFDISSEGNAHVRMNGQYGIWTAAAYPGAAATGLLELEKPEFELPEGMIDGGYLPLTPVLPGTRRTIVLQTTQRLAPGEYVLDINGSLGGVPLESSVTFAIPDAMPE